MQDIHLTQYFSKRFSNMNSYLHFNFGAMVVESDTNYLGPTELLLPGCRGIRSYMFPEIYL